MMCWVFKRPRRVGEIRGGWREEKETLRKELVGSRTKGKVVIMETRVVTKRFREDRKQWVK